MQPHISSFEILTHISQNVIYPSLIELCCMLFLTFLSLCLFYSFCVYVLSSPPLSIFFLNLFHSSFSESGLGKCDFEGCECVFFSGKFGECQNCHHENLFHQTKVRRIDLEKKQAAGQFDHRNTNKNKQKTEKSTTINNK